MLSCIENKEVIAAPDRRPGAYITLGRGTARRQPPIGRQRKQGAFEEKVLRKTSCNSALIVGVSVTGYSRLPRGNICGTGEQPDARLTSVSQQANVHIRSGIFFPDVFSFSQRRTEKLSSFSRFHPRYRSSVFRPRLNSRGPSHLACTV